MQFYVPADFPTMTAKNFLRKHCNVSLTLWRKIKQADNFSINGLAAAPTLALVNSNDIITAEIANNCKIEPLDLPLAIAYEDAAVLVVDKPVGQLVHPTASEHYTTVANAVLGYYKRQHLPYAFHPVHRLDKNTSGLVLIAKEPYIQHILSADLRNFHRLYLAVIQGIPIKPSGTITAPIARCPDSIIKRMTADNGQTAITHYRILHSFTDSALAAVRLTTGRTHQIRVHFSAIGHPLIGDDLYGGSQAYIARQALHAARLRFMQPLSKKLICLNSPLPKDMQLLLDESMPFNNTK